VAAKHRNLFDAIASFPALMEAARRAARGKRAKPGAAAFLANLEKEVLRLERQLQDGSYRPGRYKTIEIFDPKHRIVSAAPFPDRVVHHAFCAVCEPLFERGFIADSYANGESARGSLMPNTPIPGACAKPSFGTGGLTRPGGLAAPLPRSARVARRFLEQQTEEPPLRQPQQEHRRKPEQQQRFPRCPYAR